MHWIVSSAWKSYTSSPPNATHSTSSTSAPCGMSIAGIRHVTGSDDPARNGNFIFSRGVHHLLRPLPLPRQVLVVEHRRGAAVLREHLDDLLEELVPRVLDLAELVLRVLAVLADHQHRIDRQLVAAAAQGFGDASGRS